MKFFEIAYNTYDATTRSHAQYTYHLHLLSKLIKVKKAMLQQTKGF